MSPADQAVMDGAVASSPLRARYAEAVDRDSAHEMLARKLERAAPASSEEAAPAPAEKRVRYPKKPSPAPQEQGSIVHDILTSPVTKDLARRAAREIFRGVFGTARRR